MPHRRFADLQQRFHLARRKSKVLGMKPSSELWDFPRTFQEVMYAGGGFVAVGGCQGDGVLCWAVFRAIFCSLGFRRLLQCVPRSQPPSLVERSCAEGMSQCAWVLRFSHDHAAIQAQLQAIFRAIDHKYMLVCFVFATYNHPVTRLRSRRCA